MDKNESPCGCNESIALRAEVAALKHTLREVMADLKAALTTVDAMRGGK